MSSPDHYRGYQLGGHLKELLEIIEVQQPKKVPGTRSKKQTIAIIWNFIGAFDIPEEARKTA